MKGKRVWVGMVDARRIVIWGRRLGELIKPGIFARVKIWMSPGGARRGCSVWEIVVVQSPTSPMVGVPIRDFSGMTGWKVGFVVFLCHWWRVCVQVPHGHLPSHWHLCPREAVPCHLRS